MAEFKIEIDPLLLAYEYARLAQLSAELFFALATNDPFKITEAQVALSIQEKKLWQLLGKELT